METYSIFPSNLKALFSLQKHFKPNPNHRLYFVGKFSVYSIKIKCFVGNLTPFARTLAISAFNFTICIWLEV